MPNRGTNLVLLIRMGLAQNWRRRGLFEEVTFIFPNAPMIPITVVSKLCSQARDNELINDSAHYRILVCQCLDGTTFPSSVVM